MGQLIQFRMPEQPLPSMLRRQMIEAVGRYESDEQRANRVVWAALVVVGCFLIGALFMAGAAVLGVMR